MSPQCCRSECILMGIIGFLNELSWGRDISKEHLSRGMGFPTKWYVRPAKPQFSLRIRTVWSEPLLVARTLYEC